MATLVDSYTNPEFDTSMTSVNDMNGQTFTGISVNLSSVEFYIAKSGTPTGNCFVYLYAHSGNFGTDGIPTGSALATSDAKDLSSISTSHSYVSFSFTGANKYTLVNGTKYCVAFGYDAGATIGGGGFIQFRADATSPTHDGNLITSSNAGASWGANSARDSAFKVYGDIVKNNPGNYGDYLSVGNSMSRSEFAK